MHKLSYNFSNVGKEWDRSVVVIESMIIVFEYCDDISLFYSTGKRSGKKRQICDKIDWFSEGIREKFQNFDWYT